MHAAPAIRPLALDRLIDLQCQHLIVAQVIVKRTLAGRIQCRRRVARLARLGLRSQISNPFQILLIFDSLGLAVCDDFIQQRRQLGGTLRSRAFRALPVSH
jgi:hypothetical protein